MNKQLYCIKDVYQFKKDKIYQYREEDEYSIYVYFYRNTFGRIGTKFSTENDHWLDCYKLYFCTLSEMRKLKLKKLENVK